ncbi:hypothetical protein JCM1841_005674 [Sporobolomyces salmonicolor]
MSADQLVLVTGATGFVASAVVFAYLERGFRVRATARSQDKIDKWEKKHAGKFERSKLEWAIVKDIAEKGAFDEAIKGVSILAHTASPFHYNVKDNEKDMLIPALEGTRQALRAAQKEASVSRVVVTSSFASVLDFGKLGPDTTYTHEDWNSATYESAAKSDQTPYVYCASKKIAEEEAWKISKEPETKWSLAVLCPPMIFGPPQQVIESMEALNTSAGAVWDVVDKKEVPPTLFPVWVDVRDIATLHVDATTKDVAKGQRYLCIAGHHDNSQIAAIGRKAFPDQAHRFPDAPVSEGNPHFKTDSSKVEKELGMKWIPFEQSVKDTLAELFAVEKSLKN